LATLAGKNRTHAWAAGGRVGYLVTPELRGFVSGGFTEARFDTINLSSGARNTGFRAIEPRTFR
jgi:hypothetical protein